MESCELAWKEIPTCILFRDADTTYHYLKVIFVKRKEMRKSKCVHDSCVYATFVYWDMALKVGRLEMRL